MAKAYFIAGTDTGVGKTLITAALLRAAEKAGKTTLGLKPIAAGCEEIEGRWQNEDAVMLRQYATENIAYEMVNPIALKEPIAPHIAAAKEGRKLSVSRTLGFVRGAMTTKADLTFIEGAGGWRVPLNRAETIADLVKEMNVPVILVVGIRLGCINHTLLTAEAIVRDGLKIAGWVANVIDESASVKEENIGTLRDLLRCPLLGEISHQTTIDVDAISNNLDISSLIS